MFRSVIDPGQSDIERRLERLDRAQVTVFAVRDALRAAPLLAMLDEERVDALASLSFRAILTASVAAFDPTARAAATSAADAAFAAASQSDVACSALYAAARAGTAAVASHAAAAAYAGYAASCSSARAAAAETIILAEAARDLAELESGASAERLRAEPLWPFGVPPEFLWAVDRLADRRRRNGPICTIWVGWFATKIYGWPDLHRYEREWAALSDECWASEATGLASILSEIRDRHLIEGAGSADGA